MIKWKVFESKTPKQLMKTLQNWGWKKEDIINLLVYYEIEDEETLKGTTYLNICTKYKIILTECVEEEYDNAY